MIQKIYVKIIHLIALLLTCNGVLSQGLNIKLIYPEHRSLLRPIEQQKFDFKWDYTGSTSATEDAVMVEVFKGQTVDDAIKNNKRANFPAVNADRSTPFTYNGVNPDGKTFAWYVTFSTGEGIIKSGVQTFTISNTKLANNIPAQFNLCGYPVTVSSLSISHFLTYNGTAFTSLYKGGPKINLSITNVTILPFAVVKDRNGNDVYSDWRAVSSGTVKPAIAPNTVIKFQEAADYGGSVWFDVNALNFTPAIISHFDQSLQCFVQDNNDNQKVNITGTFNWQSEFLNKGASDENNALFTSIETVAFDYDILFNPRTVHHLFMKDGDDYNIMHLGIAHKTILKLAPSLIITNKGTFANMRFNGFCNMAGPDSKKPPLVINFSDIASFYLPGYPINSYNISLINDKSVQCSFNKVNLDLRNGICTVTIPDLEVTLYHQFSIYLFNFTKAFFDAVQGLYCKETSGLLNGIKLNFFSLTQQTSSISIVKSRLQVLAIKGKLFIPFLNRQGNLVFEVTEDGVQEADIDFPIKNATSLFFDDKSGTNCSFAPFSGKLLEDRIIMSGHIYVTNINGPGVGYRIWDLPFPDFYIKADGEVAMEGGIVSGTPLIQQIQGSFNGFKYTPVKANLKGSNNTYKLSFYSMISLAENLDINKASYNHTTFFKFSIANSADLSPASLNPVEINTSKVTAGSFDGILNFVGDYEFFDNPQEGKGFKCEGDFGIRQPTDITLHAKMIIARAPNADFNYWFIEAGGDFPPIPTGLLDVAIDGFTGRVYYKMKHSGTGINASDYVPNNDYPVGIYAKTNLLTASNNGITFWGDVSMELSAASLRFAGNADFITTGKGKDGLIKAHDLSLDFIWSPKKEIKGNFPVSVGLDGFITAGLNVGFDITSSSFDIKGDADLGINSGNLFGIPAFGMKSFGFDLSNTGVGLHGDFSLIDIDYTWDATFCQPGIKIISGVKFNASLAYAPFQLNAIGTLYGEANINTCLFNFSKGISFDAELMFPNPNCVSAGINVFGYKFGAGFKNGVPFFGNCFDQ